MADQSELPPLPRRDPRGHKGTFGTVVVVGGCASKGRRMSGAPPLAAPAALRAGCGLAKLAVPSPIVNSALVICPSATGISIPVDGRGEMIGSDAAEVLDEQFGSAQAVVVGPGL